MEKHTFQQRIEFAVEAILSVPQNKPEHAADHHSMAICEILKILVSQESAIDNRELLEEVSTLTEDNKNLREALEKISSMHNVAIELAVEIAKQALHSDQPKTDKP